MQTDELNKIIFNQLTTLKLTTGMPLKVYQLLLKMYFPILGFILRHLDLNNANVLYNSIIACLILCKYSIQ